MPVVSKTREREIECHQDFPSSYREDGKVYHKGNTVKATTGRQITVSEGHRYNRSKGCYDTGGPFYTSRVSRFINPAHGTKLCLGTNSGEGDIFYTGPVFGKEVTSTELEKVGYANLKEQFGSKNESKLNKDGATAISLCNPVNPASDLGTGLSESFREGLPSLPGVQTWQRRTGLLKNAGSEYLNYIFGWAPLVKEVHDVVKATRRHRDLLNQYHHGEGRDTHRRFDFPIQKSSQVFDSEKEWPISTLEAGYVNPSLPTPSRQILLVRETKSWFEGCFTYGLPSSTDSWKRAIGFGSQADQLYGLALSPSILWELTPWSWAVDWFSNAGEVINNVTNFGLAGLVMRYGYMMEETIEKVTVVGGESSWNVRINSGTTNKKYKTTKIGSWSRGIECVTKRRSAANPFGFGIGWEGLSPTQLAITAALGITRLL